jgi:hypothetical protein
MPRLENLSIGHRIAITVVIVLAILFALALYGYFTGGWENEEHGGYTMASASAEVQTSYVITKFEPRLLELEREAIDEAFRQKITSLWIVWMSDDRGQPGRAVNGAIQARKAYIASMERIEQRERDYQQNPVK